MYHLRQYSVYAFLIGAKAPKPWLYSTWQGISDATRSCFAAATDRPAVRTTQFAGQPPRQHDLKFGRLAHSAKGAANWTHQSDGILMPGESALFLSSEVWAPSWNASERKGRAPDVFLGISNRLGLSASASIAPPEFHSSCIFAVAADLAVVTPQDIPEAALSLSEMLSPGVGFSKVRPWGRSSGGGFTDAICDMHLQEPFRRPVRTDDTPRTALVADGWQVFCDTTG